ncbi:pentapeptide repeat-containing protein [Algoriphagus winogradskyi]|uniref:Pentapeptide repeat-containing protein n=1 Tax=Algoriphagus winogradskyi TaxID=237017 RepID=A0ABY1ND51_9BACT|nr:pentapeptide repeat-containing protein [Algoriphagus winogradskyi]SMP06565.1 Pentapeptide repeat-containing protein [Algoriphagus winogradskyi]
MPLYAEQTFKGLDYTQVPLSPSEYEQCTFEQCNFSGLDLRGNNFENCTFKNCDLSNTKVPDVSFQQVRFEHCKMLGIHFHASNPFLLEFIFSGCQLDYCSFYNLKIKKSKFINCRLLETDFTKADLTGSDFQGSDLSGTTFDQTTAEKVDFRNAIHYSIDPEINRIKGARFDLDGLPGLLGRYGIKIG